MDFVVAVSDEERSQGVLRPQTERAVHAGLAERGAVLLRGAFDRAFIEELHREFTARYGRYNAQQMKALTLAPAPNPIIEVGASRFDITLAMTGAFARPQLFANPIVRRFASSLLGEDMRLSSFTAVVSYPGAELQHPHRDHRYLFHDSDHSRDVPVYAINVSIPLIDVDAQTGPTTIWLGSHRISEEIHPPVEASTSVPFQRGDCILMDYRTLHTGLPNRGALARPILYLVYARTWFFDDVNHIGRVALDMSLDTFGQLPPDLHPLLSRAFSQGVRARWPR